MLILWIERATWGRERGGDKASPGGVFDRIKFYVETMRFNIDSTGRENGMKRLDVVAKSTPLSPLTS